ncbi:sigma-70 family RNA polymerase sigma factor [Tautonia sp. JC769]|uniref:sigma-70 family RNA polymerase sigma factor n=1 Tax=Tautonia sp. JC769 TaxID=3232135 RepID=UPI00345B222B
MGRRLSGDVIRQIGAIYRGGTVAGLGDEDLLDRFVTRDDRAVAEAAFQAIVTRHGPMVLGVCRRVLPDPADAEDAFQATFLVLARKARSVRVRDGSLGPWLRGVARKVAGKAQRQAVRRPDGRGSGVPEVASTALGPTEAAESRERAVLVRREVAGLPEHYRRAVELCHLEGRSIDEAAAALGRPSGTIKVRLARARALLRVRLSRRGVSPDPLPVVPAALIARTVRVVAVDTFRSAGVAGLGAFGSGAVVTLAEGALTMMAWAKVQGAGVALLSLGVTVAAVGGLTEGIGGGSGEDSAEGGAVAIASPGDGAGTRPISEKDPVMGADPELAAPGQEDVNPRVQLFLSGAEIGRVEDELNQLVARLADLQGQQAELEDQISDRWDTLREMVGQANQNIQADSDDRPERPPAGRRTGTPGDSPIQRSPFDHPIRLDRGRERNPEADAAAEEGVVLPTVLEEVAQEGEAVADRIASLDKEIQHLKGRLIPKYREELTVLQSRKAELDAKFDMVTSTITKLERFELELTAERNRLNSPPAERPSEGLPLDQSRPEEPRRAEGEADRPPAGQGDGPFDLPPRRSPFDQNDVLPEIGGRRNPEADREEGRLPEPPEWVSPEAPRDRERAENAPPEYVVEPPDMIRIEVLEALPGRPINGERLVRPDGRVSLDFYGELYVEGLTPMEIKEKVVLHLRRFLADAALGLIEVNPRTSEYMMIHPRDSKCVFVDVTTYNSKNYYIQGDVIVPGRLHVTGRDTVLDAINYANGLLPTADLKNIRLVRPPAGGSEGEGEAEVLPIDWEGIVERGETETNYTLKPGDRILVGRKAEQVDARQKIVDWFLADEKVRNMRDALIKFDRRIEELQSRIRNANDPALRRMQEGRRQLWEQYQELWDARESESRSRLADKFGMDWDPSWMEGGPPPIDDHAWDAPGETPGDPGSEGRTLSEVEEAVRRMERKLDALMERSEARPDGAGADEASADVSGP